jgi:DNA-binding transcriptional regulator YhcF (GntR family)
MTLRLSLDPDSRAPLFAQLRDAVLARIADGSAPTGTRLPTVRALADDLGVAVNTVAKAFRELEQAGVIETRGRKGSFVAAPDARTESARRAAADYAAAVRSLGLDDDHALALVRTALAAAAP